MGYQALLFCSDEKVARVAGQVFSELDFAVEPVSEPFAAVKKLMAQRYDAIVVDCENEQNASLVFKSARNSSSNRSSLAIALVEGQAGVAKAYRIGANLLLTKPINVEQAKGTLRVARGLLRKSSDAAGASTASAAVPVAPAKTSPVSTVSSSAPASGGAAAMAPPPSRPEFSEFKVPPPSAIPAAVPAAVPAMSASAKVEEKPAVVVAPVAQTQAPIASKPAMGTRLPAFPHRIGTGAAQHEAARIPATSAPAQSASPTLTSALGAGAATAPAKDVAAPPAKEHKPVEAEPAHPSFAATSHDTASESASTPSPVRVTDAPSFAVLRKEDDDGSVAKRILIAAAVVLALAAIGYLGLGRLHKSSTTPVSPAVSAPLNSGQSAPALAPTSNLAESPSTSTPGTASSTIQTIASNTAAGAPLDKTSASADNPPAIRTAANSGPGTKKLYSAPIVVKSDATGAKTHGQSEDSTPSLPSPLAVASANDHNLNGLMPASVPKPSLAIVKISQGMSRGLLIKEVKPSYPTTLAAHAHGAVLIEATITKEGMVVNPKVLSGDPVLAQAALDAVRQWRYKPYYLDGQPVETQTRITIQFKPN